MMFLDLTRFKQINDTYGHDAGDEFVVLHRCSDGRDMPHVLCQAIQNIDSRTFAPDIRISLDIGACRLSEAGDIRKMIRLADSRMYDSKQVPKHGVAEEWK